VNIVFKATATRSGRRERKAGSALQLSLPNSDGWVAARQLTHRGQGLCHLIIEAQDLERVRERMESQRAVTTTEVPEGVAPVWSEPIFARKRSGRRTVC
jgi:hypothetical protein